MITFLILYLIISKLADKNISHRWDGSPSLPYLSPEELGMKHTPFSFYSGKWKLYGDRYFLSEGPYKGVVVFFHGIGAGRNAYTRNILDFVNEGYLVYSYDYTGCMQSEGPKIYGLGIVNQDIKAFFAFLDKDEQAKGLKRYSIGHSWGGYTALMSCRNEYHIEKCVSMSGFNSPLGEFISMAPILKNPILRFLVRTKFRLELGENGNVSAVNVLSKSSTKVLYIGGSRDTMVPSSAFSDILKKELGDNKGLLTYYQVNDRGHQCYLTKESEAYLNSLGKQGIGKIDSPIGLTMDPYKATEEDPEVKKTIIHFFAS